MLQWWNPLNVNQMEFKCVCMSVFCKVTFLVIEKTKMCIIQCLCPQTVPQHTLVMSFWSIISSQTAREGFDVHWFQDDHFVRYRWLCPEEQSEKNNKVNNWIETHLNYSLVPVPVMHFKWMKCVGSSSNFIFYLLLFQKM